MSTDRAKAKPAGLERSLFILPADADPTLLPAIIPAAVKSAGEPAILVMQEVEDAVEADFVTQYRPETTYLWGSASAGSLAGLLGQEVALTASSTCAASAVLAQHFWHESSEIVVAKCDDYAAALMAAPLAAKHGVPLILVDDQATLKSVIDALKVQELFYVGAAAWDNSFFVQHVSELPTSQVYTTLGKPEYLAIANPSDLQAPIFKGLSAMAPMIASLRGAHGLRVRPASEPCPDVSADAIKQQLKAHIAHGMPKYVALVGGPHAVPPHCEIGNFFGEEKCRDAPYADLDEDIFLDVALGRIVARNLASASLLVSRIGNYDYVRDAASEGRFGMGGNLKSSADSIRPALTNVGFSKRDTDDTACLHKPFQLQVSAFIHVDHAGAGGMGHSFKYNTKVLLSPSVVSSGGCSTAGFDKLSDPMDSVVLTLLHYGAVAFLGGPRNAITASGLVHAAFWNEIALGKSIGEAFVAGWNNVALNHIDQATDAAQKTAEYVMMNIALMGDPAFKLFIPSAPQQRPAEVVQMSNGRLKVTGPQQWTKFKADQSLSDEWNWQGDLYYYGAPGATPQKMWHGSKLHDVEFPYLYARFTTTADVVGFKASEVPLPLGWTGPDRGRGYPGSAGTSLHEDRHADGSKTLMWRVRLLDYDCETGEVTGQLADQTYEMILGGSAKPTPHDLCQKGCVEAGYCCGRDSGCGRPSCGQGCEIALYSNTLYSCINECKAKTGCFTWSLAFGQTNMCTVCTASGGGSCSESCEPEGGCEYACRSMNLPAPPTTTLSTTLAPVDICKAQCSQERMPKRDDGYCCGRDSGCDRPSCQLGCEIASQSSSLQTCVDTCKASSGCWVSVSGFPTANMCTVCTPSAGGSCSENCENAGGCQHACSVMFAG
ncbi:unnamed protein product [Effrenium voratum]|uniref:Gingipain domain-containing protein n=1 Tax=Effrenium voratum TaxID=2562239 RepID=A0AA36MNK0_9DINO|nr:unnamed protein product [Effrenium voratum]